MSPPEARLWLCLKRLRGEGFHFRRQHPVRGYYLDFVCLSRALAVEVDGQGHDPERDRRRDAVMAKEGLRTLRIPAHEVRDNLNGVLQAVRAALLEAAPTRPLRGHPPRSGRETT